MSNTPSLRCPKRPKNGMPCTMTDYIVLPGHAGVDEAGRGCLVGSVFAAAVMLPVHYDLPGLTDSKKLSEAKRDALAAQIKRQATVWAVASANPAEIQRLNILHATMLAMRRAVAALPDRRQPRAVRFGGARRSGGERRCQNRRRFRRVDSRQNRARCRNVCPARAASRIRLRATQGLRHGGASGGAATLWRVARASGGFCAGEADFGARAAVWLTAELSGKSSLKPRDTRFQAAFCLPELACLGCAETRCARLGFVAACGFQAVLTRGRNAGKIRVFQPAIKEASCPN